MASNGKKGEERDRAQLFSDYFQKQIASQYATLLTIQLPALMDLIEETQDVLDEVWKQAEFDKPYPETRMRRLLEVIGEESLFYFSHITFLS
jgi:dynein heavy chain 2, cytosolic